MLNGLPILIVEDEQAVALDLAMTIEDLQGLAIGPVATVQDALTLLQTSKIAGAILDANLRDRDVTPVAIALHVWGVPFIVHTGTGLPPELARLYPDTPVIMKPAMATSVIEALLRHLPAK